MKIIIYYKTFITTYICCYFFSWKRDFIFNLFIGAQSFVSDAIIFSLPHSQAWPLWNLLTLPKKVWLVRTGTQGSDAGFQPLLAAPTPVSQKTQKSVRSAQGRLGLRYRLQRFSVWDLPPPTRSDPTWGKNKALEPLFAMWRFAAKFRLSTKFVTTRNLRCADFVKTNQSPLSDLEKAPIGDSLLRRRVCSKK